MIDLYTNIIPDTNIDTLKILQWNTGGVHLKTHLLQAALFSEDLDVVLLQETLLQENHMILVKDHKPCSPLAPINCGEHVEVQSVLVT